MTQAAARKRIWRGPIRFSASHPLEAGVGLSSYRLSCKTLTAFHPARAVCIPRLSGGRLNPTISDKKMEMLFSPVYHGAAGYWDELANLIPLVIGGLLLLYLCAASKKRRAKAREADAPPPEPPPKP
jgi:hypothetical protein